MSTGPDFQSTFRVITKNFIPICIIINDILFKKIFMILFGEQKYWTYSEARKQDLAKLA